ncbi:MAG: NAD+ synthase, partial [Acidimicrobiia bacterium]
MPGLRIAGAQINVTVGDLAGNEARILAAYEEAEAAGADLVVFPELAVTGYPPEDLLLRPAFVAQATETVEKIAARTGTTVAIIGFPEARRDLFNAAAVCARGSVAGVYRKHLLPNYAVFDEARYFAPGDEPGPLFVIGGVRVAVSVCEDAWSPSGPIAAQSAGGAELAVNISASPYYEGRLSQRETMLATRAADASIPIVYLNLVGGQDELVFDGGSIVYDENGQLLARARQFREDLLIVDLDVRPMFRKRLLDPRGRARSPRLPEVEISGPRPEADMGQVKSLPPRIEAPLGPEAEVWEALVLGTGDYVRKNGFSEVVIGLSGGVDSAVVAAVAVDALGPDKVFGVLMPSRYSSPGSVTDAAALAANLGIRTLTVPIEAAHTAYTDMLAEPFAGTEEGLAEENLQARIRGTILMTLSNKFDWMVLTTGNKSEMATGYATLYGDMAGGFAVIKDVDKTLVYRLARWRNARAGGPGAVVPEAVIDKPPSAELRPGQLDADSLPPYDVLDPILEAYVEGD